MCPAQVRRCSGLDDRYGLECLAHGEVAKPRSHEAALAGGREKEAERPGRWVNAATLVYPRTRPIIRSWRCPMK